MSRAASQQRIPAGLASYPLAILSVAMLALIATPLSAVALGLPSTYVWALIGLCGAHMLALALIPARRLPRWGQLLYLSAQCGLAVIAQTLAPPILLGYVYLAIVLQAITLFPLWLWIPFAVAVYAIWSGLLALATTGFVSWLQGNLALAFPATCAIIAVIVYARQQRKSEQVQLMLQQVQLRYDQLATSMRDLQQGAMLEERRRLAQTLVGEVEVALSRTEQQVNSALAQAQSNLERLQVTVAQTRNSAAVAVERLRGAITTLRLPDAPELPKISLPSLAPSDELVIAGRSSVVLAWVLPTVFVALALLSAVMQPLEGATFMLLLLTGFTLTITSVATQRTTSTLLLQVGLLVQTMLVLAMTALTATLPLLLGLLLILWQIAIRLPLRQIALSAMGLFATTVVLGLVGQQIPNPEALLVGAVATVAVGGPLILARRQMERRRADELRLALLNAEVEQQTTEVRTLAIAAERSRLAREVHDDLGSRLMLINLQLQLAEELATDDPAAAIEQLRTSREQLHAAWQSILAVADAELPLGCADLATALQQLLILPGAEGHHSVPQGHLLIEGELDDLPATVRATIYRTVQEGLTNARKHAQARRVKVEVIAVCGYVTITVWNDGVVTTTSEPTASSCSYGLLGLRERAETLSGGVEAGPTADGGWRLRVVIPAEAM
ncbi:MAG: sensor histidine kinase [Oscillochloridaceae bacterium umkhey_bin13]